MDDRFGLLYAVAGFAVGVVIPGDEVPPGEWWTRWSSNMTGNSPGCASAAATSRHATEVESDNLIVRVFGVGVPDPLLGLSYGPDGLGAREGARGSQQKPRSET